PKPESSSDTEELPSEDEDSRHVSKAHQKDERHPGEPKPSTSGKPKASTSAKPNRPPSPAPRVSFADAPSSSSSDDDDETVFNRRLSKKKTLREGTPWPPSPRPDEEQKRVRIASPIADAYDFDDVEGTQMDVEEGGFGQQDLDSFETQSSSHGDDGSYRPTQQTQTQVDIDTSFEPTQTQDNSAEADKSGTLEDSCRFGVLVDALPPSRKTESYRRKL
ncbi:hypothetical protein EXIGLDRAFT_783972, partial [Exidia glandulosa HHB12029]